mmetsp:Transcript_19155/g.26957  ORF Transcript_19155/g.26957 Transcript_19155/m.26957 type:complete len:315 (-) Transcript_19155:240-1184(-)|eukprot:CAMPEP_0185281146 /NCGR_PEP_ID=MMETSP1359-20130426/66556_1 /TAXON_ID=552665 /ORGANISM="Bigelowiella longifila, Strain CCMP242" /LENGTH=314 /DNA_ID=CAMNT_0027876545 /DNA_START=875 /DNA_END=1819 /DNA_ORIENTATION=-
MSDGNKTKKGSGHGVMYADEVPVEEIEALMLSKAKKEDDENEGKSGKLEKAPPKGILKKQEGKTSTNDFRDRITGMGSDGGAGSGGGFKSSLLAEKTMPEDEKKKRIGSVREFFPNFSKDYAIDLLRSFQWDVETALSMATTELLPTYLRHCDPSTYIHNPDDFLQPPSDMMQGSGDDSKATDDYRSAMMSIKGTAIKPKPAQEGFIGPMPESVEIDQKEEEIRIEALREICPHFSVDYAYKLLEAHRWDASGAASAYYSESIPETLKGVDPGTYMRTKSKGNQKQSSKKEGEGKSKHKNIEEDDEGVDGQELL